jgi:hypothetical protein
MSNEVKMMWKEAVVAYCDYLEVLTAVIMKSFFWDVTSYSSAEETICLHPQGGRVSTRDIEMQTKNSVGKEDLKRFQGMFKG